MIATNLLNISRPNDLMGHSQRIKAHASRILKNLQNHGFGNCKGLMSN